MKILGLKIKNIDEEMYKKHLERKAQKKRKLIDKQALKGGDIFKFLGVDRV